MNIVQVIHTSLIFSQKESVLNLLWTCVWERRPALELHVSNNFRQIFSILLSTFSQDVWCGSLTEMSEFKWDSDVNYYYCGSGSLIDVQNWIFKLKEFNVRPPSISSDICPIDQETISNWPFIWKLEREKYLSYQFTLHSQTFDLFYQNLWE